MKQNKQTRIVENGIIHISATYNNTIITVSDENGNPIVVDSAGAHGFSGTRKSTPHAATITMDSVLKKIITENGMKKADIFIKGIGPGREASLRSIRTSELDVGKIVDVTPIPHNGVRPPKVRRV